MTLIPKTCFFTGHRYMTAEEAERLRSRVKEEILSAINDGYTHFIAGGAIGFDTLAAEQVLFMRGTYKDIRLVLYLPCCDQSKNWTENERIRFDRILSVADEVYYVSREPYSNGCMKKRNMAMVEASDRCIAFFKNRSGGTAQTVKMAEKKGMKIINVAY